VEERRHAAFDITGTTTSKRPANARRNGYARFSPAYLREAAAVLDYTSASGSANQKSTTQIDPDIAIVRGCVVADAVGREPVSPSDSVRIGKNNGKNARSAAGKRKKSKNTRHFRYFRGFLGQELIGNKCHRNGKAGERNGNIPHVFDSRFELRSLFGGRAWGAL
jgi:hypothetical protein